MFKMRKLFLLGLVAMVLGGCMVEPSGLRAVIRTDPNPPRGPYPLTVRFDGGSSAGEIEDWVWTFFRRVDGEEEPLGTAISGKSVEYTFQERGQYRVYLTVQAKDGRYAQSFVDVDVRSQPPVARFAADPFPEVQEGKSVTFDASPSFDPDGTIRSYIWNFGDGSWLETAEPVVAHKYSQPGEYIARLVVEDDYGDRSVPTELKIRVVPKGCGSCG